MELVQPPQELIDGQILVAIAGSHGTISKDEDSKNGRISWSTIPRIGHVPLACGEMPKMADFTGKKDLVIPAQAGT